MPTSSPAEAIRVPRKTLNRRGDGLAVTWDRVRSGSIPGGRVPRTLERGRFPRHAVPVHVLPRDALPVRVLPGDTLPRDAIPCRLLPGNALPRDSGPIAVLP